MDVLRTPDERFTDLPGFPFDPHYVEVGGLRMHYLDEGPADGDVVLLLHGEPSWSYLYRTMIPVLVDAGLRAVAIDLVGFGRSDKPADRADYTYQAHVDWTWGAVAALGLADITLVCQDWGGLIGLRLVGEHPDRFARVVAANTTLPTGDQHPGDAFLAGQRFSQETPDFPSATSSTAGVCRRWRRTSSRPTTRPSPTTRSKPARGSSRRSSRPVPTTPRRLRTGRPGRCCAASTSPSCARSPIPTRSPAVRIRHCAR
ncbi:haloalkane dehalogenase [Mycolicibacterium gilvum]|uniref:haloalkane dehalogenase n=1 Tax=Mycolicibacterium gilvum TaxID=1804 RepID=UPI00404587A3